MREGSSLCPSFAALLAVLALSLAVLGIAAQDVIVPLARAGNRRPPLPELFPSKEIMPTCNYSGPIHFTVSPNFIGTTWRGWGTSLAWFANYVGGLPQEHLNTILDLLFEPSIGLGLNIVRYNIGGGHNDTLSPQFKEGTEAYWRGVPGFKPTKDGPYDWTADERQRAVLLGAKKRGANFFEAFSNSPPWWMTISGDVAGATRKRVTNMQQEFEPAFADYLTTVVDQYAKKWGVTFDSLEPFNEALEGFWVTGMDHEGCSFRPPEMGRVIKYTSDSLKAKGLKAKLVGVDSWYGATSWDLPKVPNVELLTRINVHGYVNKYDEGATGAVYESKFGGIRDSAKRMGKEVWVSEAGPISKSGSFWDVSLYMARNVIESVNIMEASAYVLWQAYDLGAHWSLVRFPAHYPLGYAGKMKPPKANKRFWIMKHFIMLAKPGSKPIRVGSRCWHGLSAFYNAAEKTVTVFVVNQQEKDRRVKINVQGFKTNVGGKTLVVIRRTTFMTDIGKRVYMGFTGKARLTVWGQTLASVTFTNVSE